MPATSPDALARKAARKAARRKERMASDPDYRAKINARKTARDKAKLAAYKALGRKCSIERDEKGRIKKLTPEESDFVFAYRDKRRARRARDRERGKQTRRSKQLARPFVGCDGEGVGEGVKHVYAYFRMGDRELYKGGRRLTTVELLNFILDSPPDTAKAGGPINVGFFFTYDVTMILADVPATPSRQRPHERPPLLQIFFREGERDGSLDHDMRRQGSWTFFTLAGQRFGVDFLPGHYFRVMRPGVKGSCRTIIDVARNFQQSFLKALKFYGVGAPHWAEIERMKNARAAFDAITPAIRDYCGLECRYLAELMTEHRADRHAAGIFCPSFDGPGSVASWWMAQEGMTQFRKIEHRFQAGLIRLAHAAYYGGRFENDRRGDVNEPVAQYDLNSAYPAGLQTAPCLDHGRWRRVTPETINRHIAAGKGLFVAPVRFDHPEGVRWCGLPFRSQLGTLAWPRRGRGVYWSEEIYSAVELGATVAAIEPGYVYERRCECKPFAWLKARYDQRIALGKDRRGYPIKIAINSVYGKTAQRIGAAPWRNPFYAGVATAWTRAQINRAIVAIGPERTIMAATDAVYAIRDGYALPTSKALGAWDKKDFSALFIVQSGLYWPPRAETDDAWKLKTRGVSRKFFEDHTTAFEAAWAAYLRADNQIDQARLEPSIAIELRAFIGHRLALARGDPRQAGTWRKETKELKFGFKTKRKLGGRDGLAERLDPLDGIDAYSLVYEPTTPLWKEAADAVFRQTELLFEAMPDYVDRGTPIE